MPETADFNHSRSEQTRGDDMHLNRDLESIERKESELLFSQFQS